MKGLAVAFCVNDKYVSQLLVVLHSVLISNAKDNVRVYVISVDLSQESKMKLEKVSAFYPSAKISYPSFDASRLSDLKLTIGYISNETYFRYLLPEILPDEEKVIYLDADLIVRSSLSELYETSLANNYLAGVRDLWIEKINYKNEIGFSSDDLYVNAGVLLMNLKAMREGQVCEKLIAKTRELFGSIMYQDQDVLNIVSKGRITELDSKWNFTSENIKQEWVKRKSAVVIHYTGEKKPWTHIGRKHNMVNVWKRASQETDKLLSRKIRVSLLIDEFFGGAGTAYGGYGFLARHVCAKYLPCDDIEMDVLLGRGKRGLFAKKDRVDETDVYRLPKWGFASKWWLKRKKYDVYLSIELTTDWVLKNTTNPGTRLVLWVQDPRPKSAWDNVIDTMKSIKDPCFFAPKVYEAVHNWAKAGRVTFISQGRSLNPLAMELYDLPADTPIQFVPNPIEVSGGVDFSKKKKRVIFLGRLEAQKRCWLFCEIASRMPEYEFYVMGKFFRYEEDNRRMLRKYLENTPKNLHFVGHLEGEEKRNLIASSRLLVSTAIWEGIPISWLEAFAQGVAIVACLEREGFTEKFGRFVGTIPGDGFDGVDKFIPAIRELMEDDTLYETKAREAMRYVRDIHSTTRFQRDVRKVLFGNSER